MKDEKRICVTFREKESYIYPREDVAFFYLNSDYSVKNEEDLKKILRYLKDERYKFYDQTTTDSYAFDVTFRLRPYIYANREGL